MRATSLLLVLATAGLAAACGGKPAPEQPAPEPTPAPAPTTAAPVDDSAERDRLERERLAREASERARAVAADLAAMINFEYDQAAVRSTDQATLDKKAAILAANPNVRLQISGHADERGSDEYNLALGNRPAGTTSSLRSELVERTSGRGPWRDPRGRVRTVRLCVQERCPAGAGRSGV